MRRLLLCAAAIGAAAGAFAGGNPDQQFEVRLSPDARIAQALSRLTFGARPGDREAVRRIGVERWIEMQLHPERIAEAAVLETRLKPLESLRMPSAEVLKEYFPVNPPGMMAAVRVNLNELLPGEQFRKVYNGTAEERRAAILALDEEKRMQVLARVPDQVVEGLPDIQKMREEARKKDREERQAEQRRLRPPLMDLLDREQVRVARNGTVEEKKALFASLDAGKREKVAAAMGPQMLAGFPDLRRTGEMSRFPQQVALDDLREAKLYRAIDSNRQLEEVLTDFWFNHFNIWEAKGQPERAMLASFERDAIRPHVLGKFRDLLMAVARHPAMLYYLDNWESMGGDAFPVGPFAPGFGGQPQFFPRQAAHGLNENYGRELLELHTLGVNGGYTQQDVIEVAKCFTGWTIRAPFQKPEFVFASFMHDGGEKTVLGHKIAAGGGESDGVEVIDILARHPSTARFIATKLAQRFVADRPPATLVERMARTFTKTDGDLRAVMETMLTSREFFSEGAREAKIKSPLEFVASAVRALGAETVDPLLLAQNVADMGEPLYEKEAPAGYKDSADAWLSTANVIARVRFADQLARGKVAGVKVDLSRFAGKSGAEVARELLGREPSASTAAVLEKGSGAMEDVAAKVAVALSSPEFQRR